MHCALRHVLSVGAFEEGVVGWLGSTVVGVHLSVPGCSKVCCVRNEVEEEGESSRRVVLRARSRPSARRTTAEGDRRRGRRF